ncbi:hypothetical protein D3C85_1383220 [compost metagenome]
MQNYGLLATLDKLVINTNIVIRALRNFCQSPRRHENNSPPRTFDRFDLLNIGTLYFIQSKTREVDQLIGTDTRRQISPLDSTSHI